MTSPMRFLESFGSLLLDVTPDAQNSLGSLFCDCAVFCLLQMYYQPFPILRL